MNTYFLFIIILNVYEIGDQVFYVDFTRPFQHPGFATERIHEVKSNNGSEFIDIFKLSHLNIPDLRDVANLKSVIIFGGGCVIVQVSRVPRYWTANQKLMAEVELRAGGKEKICEASMVNANQLVDSSELLSHILFILPEGTLAFHVMDKFPSPRDVPVDINMRMIENESWYVDETAPNVLHTVWWGYYIFGVIDVGAHRKVIEKKGPSMNGLMHAFNRGTAL